MYHVTVQVPVKQPNGKTSSKVIGNYIKHEPLTPDDEAAILGDYSEPDAFIDVSRLDDDVVIESVYAEAI